MPHVIVKLWPGRSEPQKKQLTQKIVEDVMDALGASEESISVSVEEVDPGDWAEKVYRPEILNSPGSLYKKPGYKM